VIGKYALRNFRVQVMDAASDPDLKGSGPTFELGDAIEKIHSAQLKATLCNKLFNSLSGDNQHPVFTLPKMKAGELKHYRILSYAENGNMNGDLFVQSTGDGYHSALTMRKAGDIVYEVPNEYPRDDQGVPIWSDESKLV